MHNDSKWPKKFKMLKSMVHLSMFNKALCPKEYLGPEGCSPYKEWWEDNEPKSWQNKMCPLSQIMNVLYFSLFEWLLPLIPFFWKFSCFLLASKVLSK